MVTKYRAPMRIPAAHPRYQEVGAVSRGLPDLWESGNQEQDADEVLLLHSKRDHPDTGNVHDSQASDRADRQRGRSLQARLRDIRRRAVMDTKRIIESHSMRPRILRAAPNASRAAERMKAASFARSGLINRQFTGVTAIMVTRIGNVHV